MLPKFQLTIDKYNLKDNDSRKILNEIDLKSSKIIQMTPKNSEKKTINLFTNNNEENALVNSHDNVEKSFKIEKPENTMLLPLIKKFVYKLKKSTSFFKYSSFKNSIFPLIKDQSQFQIKHDTKKKNSIKQILDLFVVLADLLSSYSASIDVFHPYNNIKIAWDMIHFALIFLLLFLIPIDFCFNLYVEEKIKIVFGIFFGLDLIITMNTSYFTKGFRVKSRRSIMVHYLKHDFVFDLITLIIFVINLRDSGHYKLIKFLFVLRWNNLEKIGYKLQEKFKIGIKFHGSFLDLINLIFFAFYILNMFACFWFYIAAIHINDENYDTWLANYYGETLLHQYFYSLYWSTVTIMTVGYGDISAKNITEIIFSTFTIFFGCGLFAYFINSVGTIVADLNKESNIFKAKMGIINKYMEKKHIDYSLQMKIREYLRFIWKEESTQNAEIEAEIINKLSKSLKTELIYESYGQMLMKTPLFYANFTEKFLSELMLEIKEVRNIPEDLIFSQNQNDDGEIFFVMKGKVQLYFSDKNEPNPNEYSEEKHTLKILSEGEIFGELAFFTGNPRVCNAKCKDFSTLLLIKREDFLKVLSYNPEDYEKYCMIRDQIIYGKRTDFLQTKCFSCFSKDHMVSDCPLIHYLPDTLRLVKTQLRDPGHKHRCFFKRSRNIDNKLNSLSILKYVQKTCLQFNDFLKEIDYESNNPVTHTDASEQSDEEFRIEQFSKKAMKINKKLKVNTNIDKILQSQKLYQEFNEKSKNDMETEKDHQLALKDSFSNQIESIVIDKKQEPEEESFFIKLPNLNDFEEIKEENENYIPIIQPVLKKPNLSSKQSLSHLDVEENEFSNDLPEKIKSFKQSTLPPPLKKGSGILRKESGIKTFKKIDSINNKSEICLTPELRKTPLKMQRNLSIMSQENKDSNQKNDEFNSMDDILEKHFEKGFDYKNFYPDHNLSKFIDHQKKDRKNIKKQTAFMFFNKINSLKKKAKNLKKSKITPIFEDDIKEKFPIRKMDSIVSVKNRDSLNLSKRHSNIFSEHMEKRITKIQHFTFYQIVYEVLHNQELRKKLGTLKQKSFLQRKKKKYFN